MVVHMVEAYVACCTKVCLFERQSEQQSPYVETKRTGGSLTWYQHKALIKIGIFFNSIEGKKKKKRQALLTDIYLDISFIFIARYISCNNLSSSKYAF